MSDTTVPVTDDRPVRSLAVDHVSQLFNVGGGMSLVAVNDVTLKVDSHPAGIISLVGASGSGKSTIARMLLGLQKPTKGHVTYDGKDVFRLSRAAYRQYRRDVQPVFQDPYAIFNPFYKADRVIRRAVKKFKLAKSKAERDEKIEQALVAVKLNPADVLGRYGHQLSGGQRQRLMLARIHLLRPAFLVADEPVSMLDAQVRKSFLDLMIEFRQTLGMTTLFITHDLSTVAYVGGTMITLFRGRIVEHGPVEQVLTNPSHPYTRLLLDSVPIPDPDQRWPELGERHSPAAEPQTADHV
jgi:ABC-type oligopeptide transport system ATPase subunit